LLALLDVVDSATPLSTSTIQRIMPSAPSDADQGHGHGHGRQLREAIRRQGWQRWPYPQFWRTLREDRFFAYLRLGQTMSARYHIAPMTQDDTRVISVVATDIDTPRMDWTRYITPPPVQAAVAGDHLTMLRAPFVAELASVLRPVMEGL
jgi:hypothetical protein